MTRARWRAAFVLLLVLSALPLQAADKPQPVVIGRWHAFPASTPLDRRVELILRVTSAEDAACVTIAFLPSRGVKLIEPSSPWKGSLKKGQVLDLPVAVRFVRDGRWTLGASITNTRPDDVQVSGAVLKIVARARVAKLIR